MLGGGGGPRDLGVPLITDMEQIDPDAVELPSWYRPNPGRASDLAFIVFTGEGDEHAHEPHHQPPLGHSAFGTASSAALSEADTVYSVTPLYHPSGLMMSIGGAIAGGARLAMATSFDPATFWEEARRYGVTVATYTWTLLHDLVEAPQHPGERHHPVRLFIGSGMPRGLWRRVQGRFSPARVLEFYASTEAGAILVNLSGTKPGSMGRPLPGERRVKVAAYDIETSRSSCSAPTASPRSASRRGRHAAGARRARRRDRRPLRGLFARDDAWLGTGDLFRRDSDGDYWRVDTPRRDPHAAPGPVFTGPIRDALGDLPAVDLAVAYGVPGRRGPVAVARSPCGPITTSMLRADRRARRRCPRAQRPTVVHVVDEIPVTTWYRPLTGPLREPGSRSRPRPARPTHRRPQADGYKPLTPAERKRLIAS